MLLLSLAATALAAGPHEDVDFDCVESEFVSSAGTVYFPVDCDTDDMIEDLPLVIFLPGHTYSTSDYVDLAEHLAGNGYATLIAFGAGTAKDRAAAGLSSLAGLAKDFSGYGDLSGELVVAGHSRGGEAAVIMAKSVPGSWDVRSVVSIAPTGTYGAYLNGTGAPSFLVITTLADGDVRGNPVDRSLYCGTLLCVMPKSGMKTGFSLWDRSGLSGTIPPVEAVTRAHVTRDTGLHYLGAVQSSQSRAYLTLWLDWQLGGVDHEDVFYGGAPITGVDTSQMRTQFKAPGALVVEDFESSSWSGGAYGAKFSPITARSKSAWLHIGTGDDYVLTSPHDTGVLAVTWPAGPSARVVRVELSAPTDVSSYDSLSFRIGQVFGADTETGDDLELQVRLLATPKGSLATVDLSDYAAVRLAPNVELPDGITGDAGNYSKSPMQTVRIPLADFSAANLTSVTTVMFILPAGGGEIHLDDVRFTP